MKLMSVQQCLVIKQTIRPVYMLFVKYFTQSNYSLLNRQLSVWKVEHRLYRSCAPWPKLCDCEKMSKLHSAGLQVSGTI